MENATKALIIAGAILIAILLISLGILIMNSTSSVTGTMTESMDSTAVSSYNSNWTSFIGTQKGSAIKTLINNAVSMNASSDTYTVTINDNNPADCVQSGISSTGTYTVDVHYNDTTGAIDNITVTPKSGGATALTFNSSSGSSGE